MGVSGGGGGGGGGGYIWLACVPGIHQQSGKLLHSTNVHIFPHFGLVKTTDIIHHNQLLLAKFAKNLSYNSTDDVKSAARCPLQITEPVTENT